MKRITLILLTFAFVLNMNGQSPSFKTYMNPVIPGDHPDCTITKVGNDFYTTGSSFNPTPKIYHSTDLVHWETISQPVSAAWSGYGDTPGGGCWGGHLVFYNGEYWDFFGLGANMYYIKTNDLKEPWSEPVKLNKPTTLSYSLGRDNSIFIDDNQKWYLLVKSGQPNNAIVELGNNGQPNGVVYNLNWLNPKISEPNNYKYSWAEGPVMWKHGGYYYYSFALNTAGGQKVMRSKTLTADELAWEFLGDLFNESDPLKGGSLFISPNHTSPAIMLSDSTSWVIHPVYAKNEWRGQGRQGLLNQVRYDATKNDIPKADYPVNKTFTAPNLPSSGIPWMVPKSDFFTSDKLHPEWSFLGFTAKTKTSLTDRPGWLRLSPKSTVKANTVIKNDGEHNYSIITRVDFNPKLTTDEAGLRIMRGDDKMHVKLFHSINTEGKKIITFSFNNTSYETENVVGDTLWFKIIRINHIVSGYYSSNGQEWVQTGTNFNISTIDNYSDNNFVVWEGTRQGLYVQGQNDAFFDLYIYRDAFTPILTECPANQSGTSQGTLKDGIRPLDNIHHTDWALYAGVEFGNGDYYGLADSVEFTASSATSGGTIEVWLDSIDTGTKISECAIASTGAWTAFKTFKAAVGNVTGRHDVYLKFVGIGTNKLFQLKWFNFTRKPVQTSSSLLIGKQLSLKVYPNPVKGQLTVNSNYLFNSVELIDLNGRIVLSKNYQQETNKASLSINLTKGIYLVKVGNGNRNELSRIVVE